MVVVLSPAVALLMAEDPLFPQPIVPSTSPGGAAPSAPRAYIQVAVTPPLTASLSAPATSQNTIPSSWGPFPTLTREHGVRCLLVSASPHVEPYVQALAQVVGPTAMVVASKMFGKGHSSWRWRPLPRRQWRGAWRWGAFMSPLSLWRTWAYG
ncbi:unnamed protein product [Lepidochelys kempii]